MEEVNEQSGYILFAPLLLAAGLAGTWLVGRPPGQSETASRTAAALATARATLIARAAGDSNRPGSLPCPDLVTDNAAFPNHPGDGKADMLIGNQCPSYIGRLPWVTLDMPPPYDHAQQIPWYVLAPGLRDDDSAEPINPETASGLNLNGQEGIAALLIAPGPPLTGQRRPSHVPADYIEGYLEGNPATSYRADGRQSNDLILRVHRDDLMAATMTRVAHEVRHCLQAHAASSGYIPWPAPLAAPSGEGRQGARFGRIPTSQPENTAETRFAEMLARHRNSIDTLALAASPVERQTQLAQLESAADWIANRLRSHRQVATELARIGGQASQPLETVSRTLNDALSDGRLDASEGSAIRQRTAQALPALSVLRDTLPRYGLDAMVWLAYRQNEAPPARPIDVHLTEAAAALQLSAEQLSRLDASQPRPPDEMLIAAAHAIEPPLTATMKISQAIVAQAAALDNEAASLAGLVEEQEGNALAAAIQANNNLLRRPSEKNRLLAEQAITAALAATRMAQGNLDTASALRGARTATAWPMAWASRHCRFLDDGKGWWQRNDWHDDIFYQASDPLSPSTATLTVNGKHGLSLVVIAAGRPLPGQSRPSQQIGDYLEGTNAQTDRNGEALAPAGEFSENSKPDESSNDRIAF